MTKQIVEVRDRLIANRGLLKKQQEHTDKLRFNAETEGDEQKQQAKWAEVDAAQAAIDQGYVAMEDDDILIRELIINRRKISQTARIDAARIAAEKANAELLTALKEDENAAQDIKDNNEKKEKLEKRVKTEKDDTKKKALQKKINGINNTGLENRRKGLVARIKNTKDRLAKRDANVIVVEADIAA